MKKQQKGMTMIGAILVIAAILCFALVGMKVMPAYLEFMSIKAAVKKIAKDTSGEINKRDAAAAFEKIRSVDNIERIKGSDLTVADGVISTEYQVVIPLFANASVLLDFNATSAK
jgi:Domain of unknown function (DUF4845)